MAQIDSSTSERPSPKAQALGNRALRTVKKKDIARAILASSSRVSLKQAVSLIDATIEEIVNTLTADEPLRLQDFGMFRVLHKRERPGRNPKNGVAATVKARKVIVFRAAPKLKDAVAIGFIAESPKLPTLALSKQARRSSQSSN